ncbi:wnt inhibitory factor 1, partial [Biomphalaria glabrata]
MAYWIKRYNSLQTVHKCLLMLYFTTMYTYVFDNFTSLDQHLLYQPLLGIPARGYIPRPATVFQITIPCKGKDMGVASLLLGLTIFDQWKRPLKGTPIDLRLKKQCVAF